jgi:hypothetical protein
LAITLEVENKAQKPGIAQRKNRARRSEERINSPYFQGPFRVGKNPLRQQDYIAPQTRRKLKIHQKHPQGTRRIVVKKDGFCLPVEHFGNLLISIFPSREEGTKMGTTRIQINSANRRRLTRGQTSRLAAAVVEQLSF